MTPPSADLYIVIPLKGGKHAKSRLAAVLTPSERTALSGAMARHVIAAARAAAVAGSQTLVVTACPDAAALARAAGAHPMLDTANCGTAAACRQMVAGLGETASLLFLNADLPFLTSEAVARLAGQRQRVMIAPDRHRIGTNALLLPRGSRVEPHFGEASFSRHLAAAVVAGEAAGIFEDPATALDIDDADDLAALGKRGWRKWVTEMEMFA